MYPLSFFCAILTTILFSGVYLTPQPVEKLEGVTATKWWYKQPESPFARSIYKREAKPQVQDPWWWWISEKSKPEMLDGLPKLLKRETSSEMNTSMPSIMEAASMLNGTNAPVTTLKSDNDAPSTTEAASMLNGTNAPVTTLKSDDDAPSTTEAVRMKRDIVDVTTNANVTTLKSDNDAPSTTEAASMLNGTNAPITTLKSDDDDAPPTTESARMKRAIFDYFRNFTISDAPVG